MYVNFELLKSRGYSPVDVIYLQLINQNKSESLGATIGDEILPEILEEYIDKELVTFVVPKNKSDTLANRVRLSSKGLDLLEEVQVPSINEDDLKLCTWLEGVYKSENKDIGNRKKTRMYIAFFRANSGIERNCLAFLCKTFMNDESQFEWSKVLEYLFFKPSSVYNVKFDLDQSQLYKYYLKRKPFFDNKFKTLE